LVVVFVVGYQRSMSFALATIFKREHTQVRNKPDRRTGGPVLLGVVDA
jgi:hypothetical protein